MNGKLNLKSVNTNFTGLTSMKDVDFHLRKTLGNLIDEINLTYYTIPTIAEVKGVFTTSEELPLDDDGVPQYELLGGIRFSFVDGEGRATGRGTSAGIVAKPLNPNLKEFPVQGEYVMIQRLFGSFFYSSRINFFNNPNNSSYQGYSTSFQIRDKNIANSKTIETDNTGIVENKSANQVRTLGDNFLSNFSFRQVTPEEGDVVLNGRFGNSIRLGSNIREGLQDSPNLKLRAGQLHDVTKFGEEGLLEQLDNLPLNASVVENINSDGSSMWLTTDEVVPLTPATLEDVNIYPAPIVPEVFDGKQIILNSGRLIFNSKEDGILGFSNGPIDFSTLNSFGVSAKQSLNLYSPTIVIGRNGEQGKTKNITLTGQDIYLQNETGYTAIMSKGIELGVSDKQEPAVLGDTLEDILSDLMQSISDLSSVVIAIATTPVAIVTPGTPTPQAYATQASRAAQVLSTLATLSIKLNTMKSRVVTLQ